MFITSDLSPAALLAELLTLRTRSSEQTASFRGLQHNRDLCPGFADRIDAMLDVYKRHRTDVHDIQGVRDNGVDVLLQYNAEDGSSQKIGVQLKSFKEIEDARKGRGASLLQVLKSQYAEAISNLGIDEWILVLCTDQVQHANTVRSICSEFKQFAKAKVIEPRQALAFYELEPVELASRVSSLLCAEDLVLRKARDEVSRMSEVALFMLLHVAAAALRGERKISQAAILELHSSWESAAEKYIVDEIVDDDDDDDDFYEGDEEYAGPVSISDALQELEQTNVIQMDEGTGFDVRPEELPGLCALYFDQVIRADMDRSDLLPILLFKMLSY